MRNRLLHVFSSILVEYPVYMCYVNDEVVEFKGYDKLSAKVNLEVE